MKFSFAISAILLAGSVQAQSYLKTALDACIQAEQDCQDKLASHMAYEDITCPDQDGVFRAAGDELYRLWCDQKSDKGEQIAVVTATSNHDCLDKCDQVTECSGGDYHPASKNCRLLKNSLKPGVTPRDAYRVSATGYIAFNHVGRLDSNY